MSDQESTLKLRLQADVAAGREYIQILRDVASAMRDVQTAQGGSSGGAQTGAPPPTPAPPPPAGGAGGPGASHVPPAPSPVPGAAAIPSAPGRGVSGANAERRLRVAEQAEARRQAMHQLSMREAQLRIQRMESAPSRGGGGGTMGRMAGRARGFASNTASTAVGMALGSSIEGFFLTSAQKYMEVDTILTKLRRTLRGAGDDANYFLGEFGQTASESAGIAGALGAQVNKVARRDLREYTGFAKTFGLDPTGAAGQLGGIQQLTRGGGALSTDTLAQVFGEAISQGMERGRFGEHMGVLAGRADKMFDATGRMDPLQALDVMGIGRAVFGADDERGKGRRGDKFTDQVHGMLTQGGPMEYYLMQQMGYGTKSNKMSYMDVRERLEAGVNDPRNLQMLFKGFQAQGLGENMQFAALEKSGIPAHALAAMVKKFNTPEGMAELDEIAGQFGGVSMDETAIKRRQRFMQSIGLRGSAAEGFLSEEQMAYGLEGEFKVGQFAAEGRKHIGRGEINKVKTEQMQLAVGGVTSQVIVDLQGTLMNLAGATSNLADIDIGAFFTEASGFMRDASGWMKQMSESPEMAGATKRGARAVADLYRSPFDSGAQARTQARLDQLGMGNKTSTTYTREAGVTTDSRGEPVEGVDFGGGP